MRSRAVKAVILCGIIAVGVLVFAGPASAASWDNPPPVKFDGIFGWLLKHILDAAQTALGWTIRMLQSPATEPQINSQFFLGEYDITLKMATFFTIPVAMLATIAAIAKGGLREVLRTYLIGFPVAILGAVAALGIIGLIQAVNLNFTDAVMKDTVNGFNQWRSHVGQTWNTTANSFFGAMGMCLFLVIIIFCAIGIWFELIFRNTMIYMAVLFLPLSLATFVWAPLRKWFFNLVEIICVMIFSKFLIAAILGMGFSAVFSSYDSTNATSGQTVLVWFMGSWIMLLAAMCGPALIGFVLKPDFAVLSRKQVGTASPFNADRVQTRKVIRQQSARTLLRREDWIR